LLVDAIEVDDLVLGDEVDQPKVVVGFERDHLLVL
jgi:hypothetical protein